MKNMWEGIQMLVTATEFKDNIGRYLTLVASEDILITRDGKNIAKLSNVKQNKADVMKSLFGIIPNDGATLEQAREERLAHYEIIS
jgi:antitoxin (DNA-binding transcriptional repressor) of toxin-antitoxin stability system